MKTDPIQTQTFARRFDRRLFMIDSFTERQIARPVVPNMTGLPSWIGTVHRVVNPAAIIAVWMFAAFNWASVNVAHAQNNFGQVGDGVHGLINDRVLPGHMGTTRAGSAPHIAGYIQPVRVIGPSGVQFSMPVGEALSPPEDQINAGLIVGKVYRFRVTGLPLNEGAEIYPTIEVIDRTYPPPGLELIHPIRVDFDRGDIDAALRGDLVTKVIFLEDTASAIDLPQTDEPTRPYEIPAYEDALATADSLGRPVAILRIGSLLPPRNRELAAGFYFGYPPYYPIYPPPAEPVGGIIDQTLIGSIPAGVADTDGSLPSISGVTQ